ncbi:family A G -coupled receptor [Lecanosticta acicola]|uniref:Family A G -coupled receptor, partial n=1 Tax=Lecanosticta acicola TaxID=111012 RepID=A0AAI9ECK4_9PEZI|nr:family A G -coupled receptor [Lecanosticta acicola]
MAKTSTATTLSPLPPGLRRGMISVTFIGFLSFAAASLLFMHLVYRIITWKHRGYARLNQYVALLTNLIFADVIQGIGWSLDVLWLRHDSIDAGSTACWTQGWFLTTGDVGICVFSFLLAVHLFADIVFDRRLRHIPFLACLVACWIFSFFCASIGIAVHPKDFYMRAGAWCWIHEKYMPERLWLHYFWILICEFATVVLYTLMFVILWRRVKVFFYSNGDVHLRAESAARCVIFYPLIYTACTLPAVVIRLRAMTGHKASYAELCAIGVMIGSNGWADVLLYTTTRHSLIFGPAIPDADASALDTFGTWPGRRREEAVGIEEGIGTQDREVRPNMSQSEDRESNEDLFRAGNILRVGQNFDIHRVEARPREGRESEKNQVSGQSRRSSEKATAEIELS